MAKRSPPIPFETGSIKPSAALAAMAASTALPPRFRTSSPICVASGTLVQTIPWRATTSERVANGLPVMRSSCAKSDVPAKNRARKTMRFIASLVAQSCHWIEPGGAIRRQESENAANDERADANLGDIHRHNLRRDLREL